MKKAALFIFAAMLAGTFSAAAQADVSRTEEFPEAGITLNFTPEFEETKGVIIPYGGFDVGGGIGIYETDLIYLALDQEEYESVSDDPFTGNSYEMLLTIFSADHGMTFDDINEFAGGILDPACSETICTVEDCTHYLYIEPQMVLPEGTDAVYVEEFEKLKNAAKTLVDNSEFAKPVNPIDSIIGSKIVFETTDLEGNPVKSEELFGSHEITMVNIWTSWCGYCIDEMEELEAINGRLSEKDCAVIGLLADGNEENALSSGKEILKEKGVTYTNILPPENLEDIFYIEGYPTTYFVNRDGIIVAAPIVGAYIDQYELAVEALLTGNDADLETLFTESEEEEQSEAPMIAYVETNNDSLYRVIVIDEDGNPVPEAVVQFCSDTTCKLGETDETGTAVFQEKKGRYTVHLLEAPEEYIASEDEFTLEEFCDLTIYLFRE